MAFRDSDSVIADAHANSWQPREGSLQVGQGLCLGDSMGRAPELSIVRHGVRCIHHQVQEDLAQFNGIDVDRQR